MDRNSLEPIDLLRVVYTSGRVFDGLRTSDLDTGAFLSTGSTEGISSKADLHLLKDLKALAIHAIAHAHEPMGAEFPHRAQLGDHREWTPSPRSVAD